MAGNDCTEQAISGRQRDVSSREEPSTSRKRCRTVSPDNNDMHVESTAKNHPTEDEVLTEVSKEDYCTLEQSFTGVCLSQYCAL